MRELKFRFIDAGDGTVYKPITLKELCLRLELPRRIILESENGDFVDTDDSLDQLEKGELIADQYTGLKDKNGKEIYEGDIVENTYEYVGKVRYEVRWECGRFIMESRKPANFVQIGMGIYPHSSEVIGNIHENPELLDGEKPKKAEGK